MNSQVLFSVWQKNYNFLIGFQNARFKLFKIFMYLSKESRNKCDL